MMRIFPSKPSGLLQIPPSKSQSIRALLFASFAQGKSKLSALLDSPDVLAMQKACALLGARFYSHENLLEVEGNALNIKSTKEIAAGNSGQILRFLAAMASLSPACIHFTGDESIQKRRPVEALLEGLSAFSVKVEKAKPFSIQGPAKPGMTFIDGSDSQPVSALLFLASRLPGQSIIHVKNPGEKPWIDLTLSWLRRFGVNYHNENYQRYLVEGKEQLPAFDYRVPGDYSSALFPIVLALISGKKFSLEGLDPNDCQGDGQLLPLLSSMGASLKWQGACLEVEGGEPLEGRSIDVNPFIDALPALAVLACFCKGKTTLYNAKIARKKESDRLFAMSKELRKMGAKIEEREDSLTIYPRRLHGAKLDGQQDHRIALALSLAALNASSASELLSPLVVAKSYPSFFSDLEALGAQFG